ncbi:putative U box domain, armadillo-like helical, Zinc finger, RING/FYVE/PHD-type [Helianthus annuus]|nr:putative U box domain, armadillo-like helical, Zinc finger, RING/FYVE/PHD-type [Helianthus annuus]
MARSLQPLDVTIQIPYHFRCPISLELMTDPVIVGTGQTYDRSSIESWIATGNTTCPVTRLPLTDFTLIPNHTLRRLIQDWCVANRSNGVDRIPTPKQPADPVMVQSLLKQASSVSNSSHVRLSAVRKLRVLARDSDNNRFVISTQNACEILLNLLFSDPSGNSSELTHELVAVLSSLAISESECVLVASDPARISDLISLLTHSSIDVRVNSAVLLENVFAGTRSQELRSEITSHGDLFTGIVGILDHPLPHPRALKVGIKALFAFCMVKQHRHKAVEAGAAAAIINRLPDFEKCDAERALATVELLCRIPSGCVAFASHDVVVPLLVKIMMNISDRATEYAAGALMSLCSAVERLQVDAVAAGVFTKLLLLVQSDCTERAKRKAQMLLKLLRNAWPENSFMNSGGGDAGLF